MENSGAQLSEDSLVYLGSRSEDDVVYWAIDVSSEAGLVPELGSKQFCFVELRTLMVATDWADERAMGELAIAGNVSEKLNQLVRIWYLFFCQWGWSLLLISCKCFNCLMNLVSRVSFISLL